MVSLTYSSSLCGIQPIFGAIDSIAARPAKLIWLVLRNVSAKWKSPPISWLSAKAQFALQFQDRFIIRDRNRVPLTLHR